MAPARPTPSAARPSSTTGSRRPIRALDGASVSADHRLAPTLENETECQPGRAVARAARAVRAPSPRRPRAIYRGYLPATPRGRRGEGRGSDKEARPINGRIWAHARGKGARAERARLVLPLTLTLSPQAGGGDPGGAFHLRRVSFQAARALSGHGKSDIGIRPRDAPAAVYPYLNFYDGVPRDSTVHILRILDGRRQITPALIARGRERSPATPQ
jgi:hypothetical protein